MDDCLYRITNTKCRIDRVISPADGNVVALNDVEETNKRTKKKCAPSWLFLQDYTGKHCQENMKKNLSIFL